MKKEENLNTVSLQKYILFLYTIQDNILYILYVFLFAYNLFFNCRFVILIFYGHYICILLLFLQDPLAHKIYNENKLWHFYVFHTNVKCIHDMTSVVIAMFFEGGG